MAFSTTNSTRRVRNRRLAAEQQMRHQQKSSPPRSDSPQNIMMSISSVNGVSPPASPSPGNCRLTTLKIGSPINARQQFFGQHAKPPSISPHSPARSWDEGERPPSPKPASSAGWKLNPRRPHTVAELGTTAASSSASASNLKQPHFPAKPYAFRRVHSSPSVGGEMAAQQQRRAPLRTAPASPPEEADMRSLGSTSASSSVVTSVSHISVSHVTMDRPPTPTASSAAAVLHASVDAEEHHQQDEAVARPRSASPALSTASSTASALWNNAAAPAANLHKLCLAVQNNEARPSGLSLEEKALWDAVQVARRKARHEGLSSAQQEQQQASPLSAHETSDNWESRFVEIQEQAVLQQRDNSRSLQAIQRALADVQAERDQAVYKLHHAFSSDSHSHRTDEAGGSGASFVATMTQAEEEAMHRDVRVRSSRIRTLVRDLEEPRSTTAEPVVKVTIQQHDSDEVANTGVDDPSMEEQVYGYGSSTRDTVEQLKREKQALLEELEWKDKEFRELERQVAAERGQDTDSLDTAASVMSRGGDGGTNSQQQLAAIRKELATKSADLENAKMIIASLENASGSLATDLRLKLKNKSDELARAKAEVAEKQKTLDTLATELRDLQKVKAKDSSKLITEAEHVKRLHLSSRLEANMAEIRAAAVILEATQDPSAVSNLTELLNDSVSALKDGIDVIENGVDEESSRRDPLRLRMELDDKKKSIRRLEDLLRQQKEDFEYFRRATGTAQLRREEENRALHAEIKILRQQCNTNMEVLTRKERELGVLRDSLQVDNDDVGYISDDDPDEEEDAVSPPTSPANNAPPLASDYGPSQAEALATLLAHGGSHSFDSGSNNNATAVAASTLFASNNKLAQELEAVKTELAKARSDFEKAQRSLKVEKESLSNAKLIISSLEGANKSMMEDLRARLQDSNTAIASLLEKSMESEKTSAKLRAELEYLKRAQVAASEEEQTALALPAPPMPFLLTETID